LIALWNRDLGLPVYGSWVMLVLGCAARFSPFAVVILAASFKLLSREQEEAALLVSNGWLGRMFRIVTPQCKAGISAAWAISFVFCLGELGTSLLVMPPGRETLTLRLFNLMHYGAGDMVALLALLVVACGLAVSGILAVMYGWKRNELWSG
jgi:iron(III) transport system permease protein